MLLLNLLCFSPAHTHPRVTLSSFLTCRCMYNYTISNKCGFYSQKYNTAHETESHYHLPKICSASFFSFFYIHVQRVHSLYNHVICQKICLCNIFVCCFIIDPCARFKCENGYVCKVHGPTQEAFCEPSCDLINGGCPEGTHCRLREDMECEEGPCPSLRSCCPYPLCDSKICASKATRRNLCTK